MRILEEVLRDSPQYPGTYPLLLRIYDNRGDEEAVAALLEKAAGNPGLPANLRRQAERRLDGGK